VQHCTPEQLALAALREPLPAADAAHLAECAACRAEVASLQRAVDALAVPELAAPTASVPPPPRVWDAIAAATGVTTRPRPDLASVPPPPPEAAPGPPAPAPRPVPDGTVRALRPRRSRLLLAGAAAAVVGAGIGAAVVVATTGDDGGQSIAAAALDPLDDSGASGGARVVERPDGTRLLEVQLEAPALDEGYYEVWLLDEEVQGLVPVGVAQAGTTTFPLPAGLDLGEFPLVDVSVEPLDGDPGHSGVSVVRGALET
jgi:Anti-sigma-K factor rskA